MSKYRQQSQGARHYENAYIATRTPARRNEGILRQAKKREALQKVEEKARCLPAKPRPFKMPPKKTAKPSYRIVDIITLVLIILCAVSLFWGYGTAYSAGYHAAERYAEVRHA